MDEDTDKKLLDCLKCGGRMIGDGFSEPRRCETLEWDLNMDIDSGPFYCQAGHVNEAELKMMAIEREQSTWMARLSYLAFIGLLWIAAWHFAQYVTMKSLVQAGAGGLIR